jgi:hypothetical protein
LARFGWWTSRAQAHERSAGSRATPVGRNAWLKIP